MRRKSKAVQVAYPAVLGALAVMLVYLACVAPTGQWGIVALGGLLPAAAVISVGLRAGFLCWAGASVLSFLLAPDKFCALLFAALFGLRRWGGLRGPSIRRRTSCSPCMTTASAG